MRNARGLVCDVALGNGWGCWKCEMEGMQASSCVMWHLKGRRRVPEVEWEVLKAVSRWGACCTQWRGTENVSSGVFLRWRVVLRDREVGWTRGRPVLVTWHSKRRKGWAAEAQVVPKGREGVLEAEGRRRGLASGLTSPHRVSWGLARAVPGFWAFSTVRARPNGHMLSMCKRLGDPKVSVLN